MAEHTVADLEERAWATAQARAFLAPPAPLVPLPPGSEEGPRPAAVVAVVIVPVPPEARGDETVRRRGDEEQGQEQEGSDDG